MSLHPRQPTGPFLDGREATGVGGTDVVNPFDGEVIARVENGDEAMVDRAVASACAHLPPPPRPSGPRCCCARPTPCGPTASTSP